MQRSLPVMDQRGFGETLRRDNWWFPNVFVVVVLSSFLVYATWAAFPERQLHPWPLPLPLLLAGTLGCVGARLVWTQTRMVAGRCAVFARADHPPRSAVFRFTCYYYRGAYYKAFWADPPACAVGEPRKSYLGENSFPLILQNLHRYGLLLSFIFLVFLWHDAWLGFWFDDGAGGTRLGMGVGSIVMLVNVVLLSGYTIGCHSMRHIVGGIMDRMSKAPLRKLAYDCSSACNRGHMNWAWCSLFSVALTDVYIRLCAMGVIADVRIF